MDDIFQNGTEQGIEPTKELTNHAGTSFQMTSASSLVSNEEQLISELKESKASWSSVLVRKK